MHLNLVFIEIAIPSIINNIETNYAYYQKFTSDILWNEKRELTSDRNYVYNSINHNHNFILHPVKISSEHSKNILTNLFIKEKCVIITTINGPTETILKHINNNKYDVIIVGDIKTPSIYKKLNCIYLDIESQKKLFPKLNGLMKCNHYCRKNLGYLYAIKKGYKIIYETDDDNIPYDNFDHVLNYKNLHMISQKNNIWINIFKYFTNDAHIWPRGYPLKYTKDEAIFKISNTNSHPSIINGLVENDPDVDAIFRLTQQFKNDIMWISGKTILIDNKNLCVFNTQNTFWTDDQLFMLMLIPSTVSFRYCDILRGIICGIVLKYTNKYMMYSSPNVVQNRNEHNLMNDFSSEYEMYINNETILDYIENNIDINMTTKEIMITIYNNLLEHNVIKNDDIKILNEWLKYF